METKICAISDIHGYLPEIPECDILCICGDIVPLDIQKKYAYCLTLLAGPFQKWALEAPCKHVIMIWGNHDFVGERLYKYGSEEHLEPGWSNGMSSVGMENFLFQNDEQGKIHILQDNWITINDIKFYGTPWCPSLRNWAFYGDSGELIKKFENIPDDFDVLLTHCPPKFGQQGVVLETNWNFGTDFGCPELEDILKHKTKVRSTDCYILSGHIHSGNHHWENEGPRHYRNVSIKDENYEPIYQPFIFTINK